MSGPVALDPAAFIRGIYTEKLMAHEWSDPAGHEALRAIPGADGRGWCEACAAHTTAEAIAAGYQVADVAAAFDGLVPPAYINVLRWAAPIATPSSGSIELTRAEILDARARWRADGPKSEAIHARLGVSKSTLIRRRRLLGLCPWPAD